MAADRPTLGANQAADASEEYAHLFRLYVAGIPKNWTETGLGELFGQVRGAGLVVVRVSGGAHPRTTTSTPYTPETETLCAMGSPLTIEEKELGLRGEETYTRPFHHSSRPARCLAHDAIA